jgi:lectin, mannose-binding 1
MTITRINDKGEQSITSFSTQGTPHAPEILSNKVILTPPQPGNARGAVWGDNINQYTQWQADVDFRVNGPERGSGNLNIWLARKGKEEVGQASIYTVGRFEGLALVIDRLGGGAGMIRGFLNDGTTDYRAQQNVDSLAFGHCDYSYRNLGRPSQIKMFQSHSSGFKVEVDGRLCFETDKVVLPSGYNFGLTAASAENPDSFEVFKMVVMTSNLDVKHEDPVHRQSQGQEQQQQQLNQPGSGSGGNDGGFFEKRDMPGGKRWEDIADAKPETFTSSRSQFADLHNRLQSVNHHLATIFREVADQTVIGEKRHEEVSSAIAELKRLNSRLDRLDSLQTSISNLEHELRNIRGDVTAKVKDSEHAIKSMIGDNHGTMLHHVAKQTTPRHGRLIFVIIGSQIVLVAGYVWYERKKTSPKKYL